jgi:16S rRNA (uracil1498-N3)-methyltransferase
MKNTLNKEHVEQIFFAPDLRPDAQISLAEDEIAHLRTLRIRKGDDIYLTDGKGSFAKARTDIFEPKKNLFTVTNYEKHEKARDFYVHIALAPTKNADRIEWFVEKATEIGIDEISFLQTEHSEKKGLNTERILKKAMSAMKQSKQFFLPKINPLSKLYDFFPSADETQKFIAHLTQSPEEHLFRKTRAGERYCVLIGPEGGFSEKEVSIAKENGFSLVNLGQNRLRTETAALKACMTLNLLNE